MKKKTILTSILSLVMCFSIITGATYALFTSESKTNIAINSGNVEVVAEVTDWEMHSLENINQSTLTGDLVDRTVEGTFLTGGSASYENGQINLVNIVPGDGVSFKIKVTNNSNVSIQYRTVVSGITVENADGTSANLIDALSVKIRDKAYAGAVAENWKAASNSGVIDTIPVSIDLPASAGKEWMNKAVSLSISVEAVQGNAVVYNPVKVEGKTDAEVQAGLNDAITSADAPTRVELPAGEYKLPTISSAQAPTPKDITIAGTKDTVIDMKNAVNASNSLVTFDGVTIEYDNDYYEGLQHSAKEVYVNCTIKGTMFLYAPTAEFVNCTFEMNDEKTEYSVWTYGASNVSFEGCTFKTHGKAILIYNEETTSSFVANVNVNNCTFMSDGTVANDKAAIETGSNPNKTENSNNTATSNKYYITVTNSYFTGFDVNPKGISTNNTIWANKNSMDAEHLFVTASNNVENYTHHGDVVKIATAEELFAFADDVNVKGNTYASKLVLLTADIDLENKSWTPIGQTGATQFLGTFDGQNHTIYNLNVDSTAQTGAHYSSGLFGWIERNGTDADYLMAVRNLTIDGATVKGNHNVAVIAGNLTGTVENCHVIDATVECYHANGDACGDKAGVIVGIAGNASTLVKDCTATDSTVAAGRDAGQIVGAFTTNPNNVINCKATNVTVSNIGGCTGANISNAIIGRTN